MKRFECVILRPAGSVGLGTGRVKTATGGYTDAGLAPIPPTLDALDGIDAAAAGSPFPAMYYRTPKPASLTDRDAAEQGTTDVDIAHVLSIRRPGAAVHVNDIAVLPAGTVFTDRPCRARIVRTRSYPTGVQCDLETGIVPKGPQ